MATLKPYSNEFQNKLRELFGANLSDNAVKKFDEIRDRINERASLIEGGEQDNIVSIDADGNMQDSGYDLPVGDVVGTTDAQTLTNKDITATKLLLSDTVWEDLQFSITPGKQPPSNAPVWATLTPNNGEWGFDVNDYRDLGSNELKHSWKEGTPGHFHLHISIPDANATGSDRFAKFTIYIAYVNASNIWTEVSLTAEVTIPDGSLDLENFYLDMGDVSFAGLIIETQVKIRPKRIAATGGTEYASDVFIHQVGCHLEGNTMGSATEKEK